MTEAQERELEVLRGKYQVRIGCVAVISNANDAPITIEEILSIAPSWESFPISYKGHGEFVVFRE